MTRTVLYFNKLYKIKGVFLDALASLELDMPLTGATLFREIFSTGPKVKQIFRQEDKGTIG